MRNPVVLFFVGLMCWMIHPTFGIVPKPGVALEKYTKPAEKMNNIGRLVVHGEKTSSCSSTLIGIDGDIGIVLTAGHCAELTSEEIVTKCRYQTLSFASQNTDTDSEKMPIIGRFALGKYIEGSKKDLSYDLGLVFVDLNDLAVKPTPQHMLLDSTTILKKSLVQVAGYGKTSPQDDLVAPQRRIMSTQAFRTQEHNHDILLLDEAEIENEALSIPVGDHPAEGDSGGPIMDAATGAIIGVVSHTSGGEFYSEPLYSHADWLLTQIKNAGRYFVFKLNKSGNLSDKTIWNDNRKPQKFRNAYGEINPIVEIDKRHTLTLDDPFGLYAINVIGQGGTIEVQSEQSAEVLRIYAPTVITSPALKTLTVDDVSIGTSDLSIQTQLRVLHTLNIQQDVVMDVQQEDTSRGLTLVDRGTVNVEGTLKTHHVRFAESNSKENFGCLSICGTLNSEEPLNHFAQTVQGTASTPGKILGDYTLGAQGVLSFNIDTTSPSSVPILTVDGIAHFTGGIVRIKTAEILPLGFEQTILTAKELTIAPTWRGVYYAQTVDKTSEITFIHKANQLSIKVVPLTGKASTSSMADDDLLK
ncbi:MAG: trypsin-like serine protease [Alphaproteobacteria bacterium]|nr:trypsin-like serine protease [Alphaproteobacteria bacterium]